MPLCMYLAQTKCAYIKILLSRKMPRREISVYLHFFRLPARIWTFDVLKLLRARNLAHDEAPKRMMIEYRTARERGLDRANNW